MAWSVPLTHKTAECNPWLCMQGVAIAASGNECCPFPSGCVYKTTSRLLQATTDNASQPLNRASPFFVQINTKEDPVAEKGTTRSKAELAFFKALVRRACSLVLGACPVEPDTFGGSRLLHLHRTQIEYLVTSETGSIRNDDAFEIALNLKEYVAPCSRGVEPDVQDTPLVLTRP